MGSEFYNQQLAKWGEWWHGNFDTWEDAEKECVGYDQQSIAIQVLDAVLASKDKPNVYERDGCVIQGFPTYVNPLIRLINSIDGVVNVLDFGGSLGSTYFPIRPHLTTDTLRWYVVEQGVFVKLGQKHLQTFELRFHDNIEYVLDNYGINVAIFSSSLPYVKNPYGILQQTVSHENQIPHIYIDRHSVVLYGDNDILTIQIVPEYIYEAIYPCWFFGENKMNKFMQQYNLSLMEEFMSLGDTSCTGPYIKNSAYKGYIYGR